MTDHARPMSTSQPATMVAQSPHCVENTSNLPEPVIECITELCESCVRLTQTIVKLPLDDKVTAKRSYLIPKVAMNSKPCQFCKTPGIDRRLATISVTVYLINNFLMGGRWSCDARPDSRIRGVDIGGIQFAMWADSGEQSKIPYLWRY